MRAQMQEQMLQMQAEFQLRLNANEEQHRLQYRAAEDTKRELERQLALA